jgi:serine/threonine-protein kinase
MKSIQEYFRLIQHYQLLPSADFSAMRARWSRPGRKGSDDPTEFCRWLVVNHYLTDFVLRVLSGNQPEELVLNQYRIYDQPTTGPFAGNYLATDPLHRLAAIQILAPSAVTEPNALREIVETTHKLMEIHHPNVGRTLDIGQAHGLYYVATQFYEGTTLADVMKRRGKLSYLAAARIMALALDGLEALHARGLAAGDLTPACLLLAPAGKRAPGEFTVKLLHPGFRGRLFDPQALDHRDAIPSDFRLRDSGIIPSLSSGPPNPSEDLLRLGRIFYQAVTGETLPAPTGPSLSAGAVAERLRDLPEMLVRIIVSMLDPDPANRPRQAAHVAKSLRVFLATEESAREGPAEERIVPRLRHALVREPDEEEAEDAEDRPPRRPRRDSHGDAPKPGLYDRLAELWEEYQPQERDLVFFALGPCAFILLVAILKMFTGWSVENIIWLVAGICLSYFVERLLKWRERRHSLTNAG